MVEGLFDVTCNLRPITCNLTLQSCNSMHFIAPKNYPIYKGKGKAN
jgi:hypothetical protein